MVLRLFVLALVAYTVPAAPAASSQPHMAFGSMQNNATNISFSQFTSYDVSLRTVPITLSQSLISNAFSNLANATLSQLTPTLSVNSSLSSGSSLFASLPTSTIFMTEVATAFETTFATVPPSTSIVTIVVTATATATVSTSPSPSWDNRTLWAPPPQITDLSAFNVTYFPSGKQNLHIVAQVPTKDVSPTSKFFQTSSSSFPNGTTTSAFLQLVYPAHSVNPGSKPEGGADFYASPLNLADARNVTLEYSVFFPIDFDWVKGGKLPGLFGGHTGCSGGASARDCFSTRLMWRPQGVGELYLYAPKDKQTASLCEAAGSVCDASYGFSVGRGAFNFTAGGWTHLQQNVVLNTLGKNDGVFELFVDGLLSINRSDIFYRDVARQAKNMNKATIEFVGLFFSTFFGGHGKEYATPKQQYTCFRDFAISRHD